MYASFSGRLLRIRPLSSKKYWARGKSAWTACQWNLWQYTSQWRHSNAHCRETARKKPRLNLTAAICPAVRKHCALCTVPNSHLLRRMIIISLELTFHGSFKFQEGLAHCNCIIIIFYFFSTDWSLVLEERFLRSWSWSCSERMCQRSRARRRTLLSSLCQRPFWCGACLLGRLRSRCGRADFKVPNPIFGGPRCGGNWADWFEIFAAKPSRERTMSERSKRYQHLTHHDVKHCAIVCSILFPSWNSSSFLGLIDTKNSPNFFTHEVALYQALRFNCCLSFFSLFPYAFTQLQASVSRRLGWKLMAKRQS